MWVLIMLIRQVREELLLNKCKMKDSLFRKGQAVLVVSFGGKWYTERKKRSEIKD